MSRDPRRGNPAEVKVAAAAAFYQQAAQALEAGRLAQAEQLCRRILADFPGNASVQHLLGLVAFRSGHLADAKSLIEQSVAAEPQAVEPHNSLGCVFLELEEPEKALPEFDAALRLQPAYPDAHANRARALLTLKRPKDAIDSSRKALQLRPNYFDAWTHLGNAFFDTGHFQDAAEAFKRAAALNPHHAGAHNNLGRVANERGEFQEAEAEFRRAIALAPADPESYINLGVILNQARMSEAAEAVFRKAQQLAPSDLRILGGLGDAQLLQGQIDAALKTYHAVVEQHPDDPEAHSNLGFAHMRSGHSEQAVEALNVALRLKPDSAKLLIGLADIETPGLDDPLCVQMEALVKGNEIDETEKRHLHFALGKILLKAKESDRAFIHLNEGNRLKRAQLDFNIDVAERFLAETAARFTPELMARHANSGAPSERPIFVVGMPRSGTTLVEQILASHPQVWGGDELGVMGSLAANLPAPGYPGVMTNIDPAALLDLGRNYLTQTEALAQGRARLVDKMPANFALAGLIALALPNARIISCRRDPVDTCLSCYSMEFSNANVRFSYDMTELGRYWRAYDKLVAHWRKILPPDRFLDVQYEDVVADIEPQARRLVAFAGLDWDDACLAFHKAERAVHTASVNQVRKPIYTSSVRRWAPFAAQLRPLIRALEIEEPV